MATRIIDIAINRLMVNDTGELEVNVGFQPKMVDFLSMYHVGDFNSEGNSPSNDHDSSDALHSILTSKGAATDSKQIVQSTNLPSDSMNSHVTYMDDEHVVYQVFLRNSGEEIAGRNRIQLVEMTSVGFKLDVVELFHSNSIIYRAFR